VAARLMRPPLGRSSHITAWHAAGLSGIVLVGYLTAHDTAAIAMSHDELRQLLQQPPHAVQQWLGRLALKQVSAPKEYNWWLSFAYDCAFRARTDQTLSDTDRLKWAHIAVAAYTYLAHISSPQERPLREVSAMNLSLQMIIRYGCVSDHPVLDPLTIERWFYDRLEVPFDVARQITLERNYDQHPQSEHFFIIARRLYVLEYLVSQNYVQRGADLRGWIELRNQWDADKQV
jgi:hypothetical protein